MERFATGAARAAAGAAVVGGAVAALVMVHRGAIDPAAIRDVIAGNPLAPLIFIALQIGASLIWVPRTILGVAAGLLFGFAGGCFWSILGALLGAAAGFGFVRWIGAKEIDLDANPRLGQLVLRAERGGWRAVAIIRLIPGLPHSLVNTALGLTRLSWVDYLAGSFVGMLPMTLVQVDLGAAGGQALDGRSGWVIGCLLLAMGLAASFLLKRAASTRA